MSVYSVTFSPTGGTDKVVNILGELFSPLTKIDLLKDDDFGKYKFNENDLCFIGVPSFGGRVPQTAVERIKKLNSNKTKAVIIAVYGNRAYEDTLIELKNIVEEIGFCTVAAVAANAQHSIMKQFGSGRPDDNDKEDLKQFALKIKDKLNNFDIQKNDFQVSGNYPYREFKVIPMIPFADKSCNKCGVCYSECPVNAIIKDGLKTEENKCISCMRCVSVCPQGARKLNKIILSAASLKLKKACSQRKKNELFL